MQVFSTKARGRLTDTDRLSLIKHNPRSVFTGGVYRLSFYDMDQTAIAVNTRGRLVEHYSSGVRTVMSYLSQSTREAVDTFIEQDHAGQPTTVVR